MVDWQNRSRELRDWRVYIPAWHEFSPGPTRRVFSLTSANNLRRKTVGPRLTVSLTADLLRRNLWQRPPRMSNPNSQSHWVIYNLINSLSAQSNQTLLTMLIHFIINRKGHEDYDHQRENNLIFYIILSLWKIMLSGDFCIWILGIKGFIVNCVTKVEIK